MWLDPDVRIHAPDIGRRWLNSTPLSITQLRGRAVLVDFWDYTCVNCLRTIPYVNEWHRRYKDAGLTVVGVHTPEFSFARSLDYVEDAVRELGIQYPVVLDNEYQVWQAFANRCWPAKYLIDKDGYVRYIQLGEGAYKETELAIQQLLQEIDPTAVFPAPMPIVRETDQPGAHCYPATPELYLGFGRGKIANAGGVKENAVADYQAGRNFQPNAPYLDGPWFADREYIEACPLDGRPSRILLRYAAAEVNLVMTPPQEGDAIVHICEEGKPLEREAFGEDVKSIGEDAIVVVKEPRMYRLVKSGSFGSKTLEIIVSSPGLGAYAFTFGSCLM